VGTTRGTALRYAIRENHIAIAKLLLAAGASVTEKAYGLPLLHEVRDLEIAQLLVANGADVKHIVGEERNVDIGNSVLHSVICHADTGAELIQYFIDQDLNVNATNGRGKTPLHFLTCNRFQTEKTFKAKLNVLLEAGADPTIRDKDRYTPLTMAQNWIQSMGFSSPWISIISEVTKAYVDLRKNSRIISLLKRDENYPTFFKLLPDELNLSIAKRTANQQILTDNVIEKVVEDNFSTPKI
jgi:ankyrin repeat protein